MPNLAEDECVEYDGVVDFRGVWEPREVEQVDALVVQDEEDGELIGSLGSTCGEEE